MALVSIDGEQKRIQFLPIGSLKHIFGSNQYNEPIWRVVWSESVYYMVGANHNIYEEGKNGANDAALMVRDGKDPNLRRTETCYRWLPLYPGTRQWILEKWTDPISYCGMSPQDWEIKYKDPASGLLTLGPYPHRGVYVECFRFPETPSQSTVYAVINRIRAGWKYSYSEHRAAVREAEEKKEKTRLSNFRDFFLDRQQAFKNNPSSARPGKRTKDAIKFKYSAEDLKMKKRGLFSR